MPYHWLSTYRNLSATDNAAASRDLDETRRAAIADAREAEVAPVCPAKEVKNKNKIVNSYFNISRFLCEPAGKIHKDHIKLIKNESESVKRQEVNPFGTKFYVKKGRYGCFYVYANGHFSSKVISQIPTDSSQEILERRAAIRSTVADALWQTVNNDKLDVDDVLAIRTYQRALVEAVRSLLINGTLLGVT